MKAVLFFLLQDLTILDLSTNESPACAHCHWTFGHSAQTQPCQAYSFQERASTLTPSMYIVLYTHIYVYTYVYIYIYDIYVYI